ncbi:MAG TPA: hypothetical protein VH019_07465 [Rhizomicrobium sp.]|nr:hypothetical protein [Rhizomicrobium sp.]
MITTREAHDALQEAATAERRSAQAYGYSRRAPFCILWGLIWMAGYGGTAVLPGRDSNWLWLALAIIGTAISIWIGNNRADGRGRDGWRAGLVIVFAMAFTAALLFIMHPTDPLQVGAYWPLLLSAIYASIGLWLGLRYILLGAFLAIATLGAYFFLKDLFFAWTAVVGGGSILLTGLWMRHG